jgi:hypothetical protein
VPDNTEEPLASLMVSASRNGMNVQEGIAFLNEWFLWLEHTQDNSPDVFGFLPMRWIQFWVALRRGWGNWHPSQYMLDDVRRILLPSSIFRHVPMTGQLANVELNVLRNITRSGSTLLPGEQARLERLLEERSCPGRVSTILDDWETYLRRYILFRQSNDPGLRLDRLERLIREERAINAHRGHYDADGQWRENQR